MVSVFQQTVVLPESLRPAMNSRRNRAASNPPEKSGHRSGAVARMLGMPVATLRVWERRYALCQPQLTSSGQRLYSAGDVRRLAMIKQLTERGHAIGSLAELTVAQLQAVVQTHLDTTEQRQIATGADENNKLTTGVKSTSPRAWRVAAVGLGWTARLQPPQLRQALGRHWDVMGPFATLAQAAKALKSQPPDALLVHEAGLHEDWLAQVHKHATLRNLPLAVLYGFAAEPVCEQLAGAGVALLQEPQSSTVLAQWLHGWCEQSRHTHRAPPAQKSVQTASVVPAPRWDDAALTALAQQASSVACECPKQLAQLLMQLQHFETYSASCAHRTVADAQLHAYLHQVAAAARLRFETALERVALHEGIVLPPDQH